MLRTVAAGVACRCLSAPADSRNIADMQQEIAQLRHKLASQVVIKTVQQGQQILHEVQPPSVQPVTLSDTGEWA
jgi:hypothetical protein